MANATHLHDTQHTINNQAPSLCRGEEHVARAIIGMLPHRQDLVAFRRRGVQGLKFTTVLFIAWDTQEPWDMQHSSSSMKEASAL